MQKLANAFIFFDLFAKIHSNNKKDNYMKKFWAELKAFIAKGNVVDLAIAVIIGAAFNKIVSSLVNDVIMPLISCAVGGADVSDWKWVIRPAEYGESGEVLVAETALKYGNFIQTIIDFLIIACTLFIIFKIFTYAKNKLEKFGNQVINETKKIAKEHKKLWKNYKKKVSTENPINNLQESDHERKDKDTIEDINSQENNKDENSKTSSATKVEQVETTPQKSKDELMIELLTEIRDSLNSANTNTKSK